jgi:serine/threonine-protein kinase
VAAGTLCPADGTPLIRIADLAAADGDPMLGRVLAGRFTILARLGAGSMGTVYRAKQSPIGREVAIKILRSDRAVDEVSRARFLREARANSVLTSPNTVTVFDFGQSDEGDFYLAMELLEGESLGQRLKRLGRIPVSDAVDTAKQALRSLSEAHAKGIIHRDLKPDNLFYAYVRSQERHDELVKVLDFGIAKMLRTDGELEMNAVETQAGTVFGTPRYMSPEQAQGKPLDARSDLYSLGVILYHMLAGRPPFTDDDAIVVMARHIKTPPRPLAEVAADARIPPELEALVMRVLSKEPERRPDSADAFIAELTRAKESAVVTSGIRASLDAGLEAVLDRVPRSSRSILPPPMTETPAGWEQRPSASMEVAGRPSSSSSPFPPAEPFDTQRMASLAPSGGTLNVPGLRRPRWWAATIAILSVSALVGVTLALTGRLPTFAATANRAATMPPVAPHPNLAPPSMPYPSAAAPSTVASPSPSLSSGSRPASSASSPMTTSSTAIPTIAASALPRSEPTRQERSPRARPPTRAAGTSSVGYGYLE